MNRNRVESFESTVLPWGRVVVEFEPAGHEPDVGLSHGIDVLRVLASDEDVVDELSIATLDRLAQEAGQIVWGMAA